MARFLGNLGVNMLGIGIFNEHAKDMASQARRLGRAAPQAAQPAPDAHPQLAEQAEHEPHPTLNFLRKGAR